MKSNLQGKDKNSEKKIHISLLEKMAYPAKYLALRYSVSKFFIYLILVFVIIGILLFVGMQNLN